MCYCIHNKATHNNFIPGRALRKKKKKNEERENVETDTLHSWLIKSWNVIKATGTASWTKWKSADFLLHPASQYNVMPRKFDGIVKTIIVRSSTNYDTIISFPII